MSKFTHYRIFAAVVETGSIAQAALKLNYSAPAISKQLTRLEQSLQVQLFHRSHKKLELTEAGLRFYPRCKGVLASIAQAEDELLADHEAIRGTISITLSKALCRSSIFDVLSDFTAKHPEIHFDIRFGDQLDDLHDESLDFAFRLGKLPDHSHMIATPLMETRLQACATPEYLAQHGVPSEFSEMGSAKLILQSPLNSSEALRAFFHKEHIRIDPARVHTCDDIEGVYQAVRAGLGIGLLLDVSIEQEVRDGTFKVVFPDKNLPRKQLYLVSKKSEWQTQKHLAFKAHIKAAFSGLVMSVR